MACSKKGYTHLASKLFDHRGEGKHVEALLEEVKDAGSTREAGWVKTAIFLKNFRHKALQHEQNGGGAKGIINKEAQEGNGPKTGDKERQSRERQR